MKTRILVMSLLLAPVFLFGQLGIGIKGGANFSNLSSDNFNTSSVTSYHAGVYANIKLSEKFGVTPEVLWSSQGADLNNVKLETNYITVPVMLRWRIINLISLEAGPQFNILTSAESGGMDVTDDLSTTSFCAAFGGLVHLPLGFNAGVRYVMGLSDLSDNGMGELMDRTFQVYVGWTIIGSN
jgi:hypothetical protein